MKRKSLDRKLRRPKFCYDPSCKVIYSTWNTEHFNQGNSFFCFGKLAHKHEFREKETLHINNLSHCYYTPLKGMVRFFTNEEDIWGEANAKLAVLNRLVRIKCERCGGKMYKVIRHECFNCGRKAK